MSLLNVKLVIFSSGIFSFQFKIAVFLWNFLVLSIWCPVFLQKLTEDTVQELLRTCMCTCVRACENGSVHVLFKWKLNLSRHVPRFPRVLPNSQNYLVLQHLKAAPLAEINHGFFPQVLHRRQLTRVTITEKINVGKQIRQFCLTDPVTWMFLCIIQSALRITTSN